MCECALFVLLFLLFRSFSFFFFLCFIKKLLSLASAFGVVCAALCSVNTYSVTGLEPCTPCPVGSYQPSNGSVQCIPCAFDVGLADAESLYCPGTHWLFIHLLYWGSTNTTLGLSQVMKSHGIELVESCVLKLTRSYFRKSWVVQITFYIRFSRSL